MPETIGLDTHEGHDDVHGLSIGDSGIRIPIVAGSKVKTVKSIIGKTEKGPNPMTHVNDETEG